MMLYFPIVLIFTFQCIQSEERFCDKDNLECEKDENVWKNSDPSKISNNQDLHQLNFNNFPPLNDPRYVIKDSSMPIILWWTPGLFPHEGDSEILECPRGKCLVTKNRAVKDSTLTRGFIFYGTSFSATDLPLPRLPHHEWALFHEESPKNQWMLSDPLGISFFNHTATFKRQSDYPLSTQFIPDIDEWIEDTYFVSTKEKNRLQKEEGLGIAVFVHGDCNPPSDRDTYVKELMKYIKIDSYGNCVNNKQMPENIRGFHKLSSEPYYHFLAKYKFQIAFENCLCQDYMTEKLFRPLCIGSVPVYMGSSGARDFMPTNHSIIMVEDFATPKNLGDYLNKLNEDDTLYNEYLTHRKTKKITNEKILQIIDAQPWKFDSKREPNPNFGAYMFSGFSCHVCDQIHLRHNQLKKHIKDASNPILPPKIANAQHMGCPIPQRSLPNNQEYNKQLLFKYGQLEAETLLKMLRENETDSTLYTSKYLLVKTDKYP